MTTAENKAVDGWLNALPPSVRPYLEAAPLADSFSRRLSKITR